MISIKDNNTPSLEWQLGRISEVHLGEDEIIRVATVKTPNGFLKRLSSQIAVLPISDNAFWKGSTSKDRRLG